MVRRGWIRKVSEFFELKRYRHGTDDTSGAVPTRPDPALHRDDGGAVAGGLRRRPRCVRGRHPGARLVRLSYLAPDIIQAILDRRQPRDLTADDERTLSGTRVRIHLPPSESHCEPDFRA
jgi:hypothetical protein